MITPETLEPGVVLPRLDGILTGALRLYKKCSIFLGFLLLSSQITPLWAAPDDLQSFLQGLPDSCPAVPASGHAEIRQQLTGLYQQRAFQPAWAQPALLASLVAQLEQLADDGLNPANYQLPAIREMAHGNPPDACLDILASHAYLQALHDLHWGRLARNDIEPLWHSEITPVAAQVLTSNQLALSDLPKAFNEARPTLPQYQQLRQSYARVRQATLPDWPQVASGPLLKPGMQDPRLPVIEQRLIGEGYMPASTANPQDLQYNEMRLAALKDFQRQHALQADGIVGPGTLSELNISPAQRREQLRINLERWRWLAPNIDSETLLVDISAAQLSYYRDRVLQWKTRTQVGRAERPTPQLKSVLTRITLNPTWTVPPTILKKDKIPAIQADPGFLAKHQMRVLDLQGKPLDPTTVDWLRPGAIMLRQDAGPQNPLGKMALRFPNPFSVYLHDTPSQALFEKSPRAFSSGCVRVEAVGRSLELLLSEAERKQVDGLLASGNTVEYKLPRQVPIIMAYWTAEADESSQPLFRPDIYGHDARLIAALNAATR